MYEYESLEDIVIFYPQQNKNEMESFRRVFSTVMK